MININTKHILVLYTISYGSLIIPKIHFHIQYFTISNQFKYAHNFNSVLQFNSVLSINSVMQINSVLSINSVMQINSVMPLTNLTYVFDIQDIRVTSTVPLGYKSVSNGFITQYGPAGLLIGVTHQYNSSQYCYLTPIGIPIYP